MIEINPQRLLSDLYELREIGRYKTGVHRPSLSPEDMEARRWLADKLAAISYETEIDGIANVIGRAPGDGPRVLAGSHLESQNYAGWLDGALGVIYALEAARAVAETPSLASANKAVDVIAFSDEEGHFSSLIGSYSFCGEVTEEKIDTLHGHTHGRPMREMLAEAGLADKPRARLKPERYRAFLEAHIEQGEWLESQQLAVGVVTSIVAIWQYRVIFEGVQNHAGTTRMAIRKDAGVALMKLWEKLEAEFPKIASPTSVWTTGRVTLEPGAPSIIPGRAEMLFQFRDVDQDVLDRFDAKLTELVEEADHEGPCSVRLEVMSRTQPFHMAESVLSALDIAAEQHTAGRHIRMPSGAGHDAQNLARYVPTAMLFIPSISGISHHWSENTSDEDIVCGARVFASAIGEILAR